MPRPTKRARAATQSLPKRPQSAQASRNAGGLVMLSAELFLQIASYFPPISSAVILDNPTTLSVTYRERFSVLQALSQTCQYLRSACLAPAWERFEACTHARSSGQFFKEVGNALERKSKGLLKCKHLLPHVRIVTVSLTRYQAGKILPPFAQCLAALPNLHTIQVVHAHSQMTTPIRNAFEGKSFPTVRTVIMPSCAHEILRCCPAVEDVTCNKDDGSKLVGALVAAKCNNLVTLRGISLTMAQAKRLVKTAPNLSSMYIYARESSILELSVFKKLSTIQIQLSPQLCQKGQEKKLEDTISACVKAAWRVLEQSSSTTKKVIKLTHTHTEPGENRNIRPTKVVEIEVK